uniref:NADH-ubiquinone oxidoreductase chain 6 n=1 Tax=Tychus niger TaxID=879063 RepID=A0A0M3LTS4_9COLE|nr:NADH dehydrogenase subunit 6 [Tychus niger]
MMILNMMISISLMFMIHPMSMGISLLMQTLLICLITGSMNNNFWFSYILFITMIGGLLILFLYMTSIASNELLKFSKMLMLLNLIMLIPIISINILMDKYFMFYFNNNNNLLDPILMNKYFNKFFNYPNFLIMLMLIIYLFITLIATVKITNIKYGPMRKM